MPYNFAFYLQTDAKVRKVSFGWCLDVGLLGFDLYMDLLNRLYFPTKSQLWPFAKMIALFSGFFGGFNFHFLILAKINWVVVSNIFYFHPEHWGRFSPILTCAYFSDGWFNHQQVKYDKKHSFIGKASHCSSQARSLADEPVDSGGSETIELVGHWVRTHVGWARGTQGREPKWVGIGREKVCVGKIRRKRNPGCFIWLYSFVFLGGNDLAWRY